MENDSSLIPVQGMLHASWTVENMDRTLPFYVDLLGLEVVHTQIQDNEYTAKLVGIPGAKLKVVLLKFRNQDPGVARHVIELVEYLHPKGIKLDTKSCNVGAAHFAFLTPDCFGMYEFLSAKGVTFLNPPVSITAGINKGGMSCYLRDPDNYTLELMQLPQWRMEGRLNPEDS